MTQKSEVKGRTTKLITHVSENWATTKPQLKKITFTWSIKNYSICSEESGSVIYSPTFPEQTFNGTRWYLQLYPLGLNEDCKNYVSVFLVLVDSSDILREVETKIRVSVLNARYELVNTCQTNRKLYLPGKNWGFDKFVTRNFIFDAENGMLPDDKLTIFCEIISIAQDKLNKSGTLTIPKPKCDLPYDFGVLLKTQKFFDVTLCAEGKEMKAHKLILSARSSVFEAMFSHEMQENKTNRVEIKDVDPEILEEMLCYIYSGEAPRLGLMTMDLLFVAEKYALKTLKLMCEKELCASLSTENAAEIFRVASIYNTSQLKVQAKKFLVAHSSEVVKTYGWKSLVETHPHFATEALLALVI